MAVSRRRFLRTSTTIGAAAAAASMLDSPAEQADAAHTETAARWLAPQATPAGVVTTTTLPSYAVIALNRMGYGPRPGDVAAFVALGATPDARLQVYVDQQLNPAAIDDSACDARIAAARLKIKYDAYTDPANPANDYPARNEAAPLGTLDQQIADLWPRARGIQPYIPYQERIRPFEEARVATWIRAVYSKRQLQEVLVDFWHNHFIIQDAGKRTIETIKALRGTGSYTPLITYPSGGFGDSLKAVAQMIKLDLGLRVATVDLGGWDHHENEGVNDTYGPFNRLAGQLAQGLHAFYNDLPDHQSKLTVVVMSEFGRRLGMNSSSGTDHGHGNMMMVLGGQVNGGKLYGTWKGLETENLDQGKDVAITTDFRTVLSEIVVRQLSNTKLGAVFPGITPEIYSPATKLNIVSGPDPEPDYTAAVGQVFVPLLKR